MIEKGEFVIAGQRRQPQRQLRQFHGARVLVHPIQAVQRHQPPRVQRLILIGRQGRRAAMRLPRFQQGGGQLLADFHQKRPRPHRRIAHLQAQNLLRRRVLPQPRQHRPQRLLHQRPGQLRRGVMRAGLAALVGRLQHQRPGGHGLRRHLHRNLARQRRQQSLLSRRGGQRRQCRPGQGLIGGILQPLRPLAGRSRPQRRQIHQHRRAVSLGRLDRDHRPRRPQQGKAHHRLVH